MLPVQPGFDRQYLMNVIVAKTEALAGYCGNDTIRLKLRRAEGCTGNFKARRILTINRPSGARRK
jgi:hypothetical protein